MSRCNYEDKCVNDGLDKDPREYCFRCTRYIHHENNLPNMYSKEEFMKDFSKIKN